MDLVPVSSSIQHSPQQKCFLDYWIGDCSSGSVKSVCEAIVGKATPIEANTKVLHVSGKVITALHLVKEGIEPSDAEMLMQRARNSLFAFRAYEKEAAKTIFKQEKSLEKEDKEEMKAIKREIEKLVQSHVASLVIPATASEENSDLSACWYARTVSGTCVPAVPMNKFLQDSDVNTVIRHVNAGRFCPNYLDGECAVNEICEGFSGICGGLQNGRCTASMFYEAAADFCGKDPAFMCRKALEVLHRSGDTQIRPIPLIGSVRGEDCRILIEPPTNEQRAYGISHWNEILSRCSSPLAFCSWIAKLFTNGDKGRQALFLLGGGQTGSTTILTTLSTVINSGGDKTLAGAVPGSKKGDGSNVNSFQRGDMAGRLLSFYSDTEDQMIAMSESFKQTTGGDMVHAEHKGGKSFSVNAYSKVIIVSNIPQKISTLKQWSASRVLPVRLKIIPESRRKPEAEIKAALIYEFPSFLEECRRLWEYHVKNYSDKVDVPLTREVVKVLDEMAFRVDAEVKLWIDQHIYRPSVAVEKEYSLPDGDTFKYAHPLVLESELLRQFDKMFGKLARNKDAHYDQQKTLDDAKKYLAFKLRESQVEFTTVRVRTDQDKRVLVQALKGYAISEEPLPFEETRTKAIPIPDWTPLNLRIESDDEDQQYDQFGGL